MFVLSALLGCVGGGALGGGGGGGASGGGGGGVSGGTVLIPDPGACTAPDGHVVPSTTLAELEARVVGDWLRCSGTAFPAELGVGIRISPDHTWSALVTNDAGARDPFTSGFDGYGTWSGGELSPGHFQFNLHFAGGGAGGSVTFTDSGQMRMDWGGVTADYERLNGGGGSSGSGGGGSSGGTVPIPDPEACSAPDGHVVPGTTLADLERMIVGDWLRCDGNAFPAQFGVGLRISPDHTWNALVPNDAGALQPITTGFDGYGTWSDGEITPGHFQFNLHPTTGGGAGGPVTFTDSGQMRMDWGGVTADYVRLGASANSR